MNSHLFKMTTCLATAWIVGISAWNWPGHCQAAAGPLACEVAKPRQLPPGLPKASDVMMRSLVVHPRNVKDPHDTLAAARAFHVTRLDWIPSLDPQFVQKAKQEGMIVSGSTSSSVPKLPDGQAEKFSLRDINGNRVCMVHKRGWPWNVEGCVNNSDYCKWYRELILRFVDMGCTGIQRDEPGANIHTTRLGGCFCSHCIAQFRRFLAAKTTAQERGTLGVEPLESFDYAAHLRKIGAPAGDAFEKWDGGPLKQRFLEFQEQSTVDFHRQMRRATNAQAGRVVPWSCNNGARHWEGPEMVFDFFIGELSTSRAKPKELHDIFRQVEALGKFQVTTMPLKGTPIVDDDIRPITRRTIATVYALGGLCMVPWDTYMPKDQPRYFGKPEAYADLYGFVRGVARYLDGYEYAGAFGKDLLLPTQPVTAIPPVYQPKRPESGVPSAARHSSAMQTSTECSLYGPAAVRMLNGGGNVWAFVRAVPGDRKAPVAIHLVDWSEEPKPFALRLNVASLVGAGPANFRLLAPAPYDAAKHAQAQADKSYAALVTTTSLAADEQSALALPALAPWGILLVEPGQVSQ